MLFRPNSIHGILNNEKYTGVYIYNRSVKKDVFGKRNGHVYKGEHEIIRIEGGISEIIYKEGFQRVQEILKMRKQKPGANKAKENYLQESLNVVAVGDLIKKIEELEKTSYYMYHIVVH